LEGEILPPLGRRKRAGKRQKPIAVKGKSAKTELVEANPAPETSDSALPAVVETALKGKNELVTAKTLERLARTVGRHDVAGKGGRRPGMKLTVRKGGLAYWTYRFQIPGDANRRDTEISLGRYPETPLDEAAAKHATASALVENGKDPRIRKRVIHAYKSDVPTFRQAAERLIEQRERLRGEEKHRNRRHEQQWRDTLMRLPAPFLELKAVAIGPKDVYDVLKPSWDARPVTAARVRGRIAAVLDSAREPDDERPNPAAWSGWLKTKLGPKRINRDPETGGRAHLPAALFPDIPGLMARLAERQETPARALRFVILSALRTGEVRGLVWSEIRLDYNNDGEFKTPISAIVIPAKRMKMYRRHRLPLSSEMLAILEVQARTQGASIDELVKEAKRRGPDEAPLHVFPGTRLGKPMAVMMLRLALRRAGGAGTVHGLRSCFRSWAKANDISFQAAEEALAHVQEGGAVVQAYARDDMLLARVGIMQRWARFCLSGIAAETETAAEIELPRL
jgi:integrase